MSQYIQHYQQQLKQFWQRLTQQQKLNFTALLFIVAIALCILLLIVPAYKTIKQTNHNKELLQKDLQLTLSLAKEATQIKQLPYMATQDKLTELTKISNQLFGNNYNIATLSGKTTVTIKAQSFNTILKWLNSNRNNARMIASEVNISANSNNLWNGTILFSNN